MLEIFNNTDKAISANIKRQGNGVLYVGPKSSVTIEKQFLFRNPAARVSLESMEAELKKFGLSLKKIISDKPANKVIPVPEQSVQEQSVQETEFVPKEEVPASEPAPVAPPEVHHRGRRKNG